MSAREAILAPASSIQRLGELELVQVAADGLCIPRLVKTGMTFDGRIEILSGLQPGERILNGRPPSR